MAEVHGAGLFDSVWWGHCCDWFRGEWWVVVGERGLLVVDLLERFSILEEE